MITLSTVLSEAKLNGYVCCDTIAEVMDKAYDHTLVEDKLYKKWEEQGLFKPEVNPDGSPFTIILPPPNANGSLHFGHAMFVVEDILIRYHRMKGEASLWLPGTDHAGTETQFVFEKKLQVEGKSRFDFTREELYSMINDFVEESRGTMQNQLRKLGFSLDWSREKYTLDPDIIAIVYQTFKKMYDDGLVYRGNRLVNFCTRDGTGFSDLETVSEEKEGILYHIKYPLVEGGEIIVATTRPETMFGDVAVMVHPEDARYKDMVGKLVHLPLTNREIPIIADLYVEQAFGTGAVKVTPGHDINDFEVGKRHSLPLIQVIGFDGKLQSTGVVDGLYSKQARVKVLELLKEKNLLEGEASHNMVIKTCYKCKTVLEPLPLEQWYVKVKPLTKAAIEAVKKEEIQIFPKNFENWYFQWLENLNDWNISRQIVWGIRIPAWKCGDCQAWSITDGQKPTQCSTCTSTKLMQDNDTFDTWFSSGQWPFATLQAGPFKGDFEKFYPTSVMETAYDILKAWVSRMVMLGIYATGEVPFKNVLFHGIVNDPMGKKMSKSKGNVVNPLELIDTYGADAVRFALVYGNATGSDQSLAYPKLDAARKFTNKLWNMARFIEFQHTKYPELVVDSLMLTEIYTDMDPNSNGLPDQDKLIIEKTNKLVREITEYLDRYQFNYAAEKLYEFAWHEFADVYIEESKVSMENESTRQQSFTVLVTVFSTILKLLHPFMPFVTEELYGQLKLGKKMLIIESWPFVTSSSGQANNE
jgi:valyl-tRNA synthetase